MLPKLMGTAVVAGLELTSKPVPAPTVLKITPRGEFTLKKLAGRRLGAESVSGTPSQLISRRPEPNDPVTFGLRVPRAVWKLWTVGVMAAAFAPLALKKTGVAVATLGVAKARAARIIHCRGEME